MVILRIPFDNMIALLVAQPSLSNSLAISIFVDAPIIESTTIVTNLSLFDFLTDSVAVTKVIELTYPYVKIRIGDRVWVD